ncbi:hypothetical protein CAOG_08733 [Capsaspora owczarzaki ATCC 30864]|uniref:SMP-LTD domain-containing protein n=1 Tax=Capsaspora owczarzaki (strain ATCC 30864) TaxID=595528 RepID=A0A0D2WPU9_CAPO3|nr:hypothetical protein CAOG_08733 [Capsaspora owczarzaki ATCC 30864]KJE92803.1 hypothetical protein CAOG_008733 [Capsaspora owczarzaki ATCC 30864]|eukprot:XP_011270353.1 hypothetical protein CAOG_08733 [Capsaspora owczarzaki ATCC 30864]
MASLAGQRSSSLDRPSQSNRGASSGIATAIENLFIVGLILSLAWVDPIGVNSSSSSSSSVVAVVSQNGTPISPPPPPSNASCLLGHCRVFQSSPTDAMTTTTTTSFASDDSQAAWFYANGPALRTAITIVALWLALPAIATLVAVIAASPLRPCHPGLLWIQRLHSHCYPSSSSSKSALPFRTNPDQGIVSGCGLPVVVILALIRQIPDHDNIQLALLLETLLAALLLPVLLAVLLRIDPQSPNAMYLAVATPIIVQTILTANQLPLFSLPVVWMAIGTLALSPLHASFTVGEATLVLSFVSFMAHDCLTNTATQLIRWEFLFGTPAVAARPRSSNSALHRVSAGQEPSARQITTTVSFFGVVVGIILVIYFPWLSYLLGENPFAYAVGIAAAAPSRLWTCALWLGAIGATIFVLNYTSVGSGLPGIIQRKFFHFLATSMFLPVALMDVEFLRLSIAIALSVFILFEMIRAGRVWPFGQAIHEFMEKFVDERDAGNIVLTHSYLLLGCALPIWFSACLEPASSTTNLHNGPPSDEASLGHFWRVVMPGLAGLAALGVGDAMASLVGVNWGRTRWPGTSKSVVGTLGGGVAMFVLLLGVVLVFPGGASSLTLARFVQLALGCTATALFETFTQQIDNLVLPLFSYAVLSDAERRSASAAVSEAVASAATATATAAASASDDAHARARSPSSAYTSPASSSFPGSRAASPSALTPPTANKHPNATTTATPAAASSSSSGGSSSSSSSSGASAWTEALLSLALLAMDFVTVPTTTAAAATIDETQLQRTTTTSEASKSPLVVGAPVFARLAFVAAALTCFLAVVPPGSFLSGVFWATVTIVSMQCVAAWMLIVPGSLKTDIHAKQLRWVEMYTAPLASSSSSSSSPAAHPSTLQRSVAGKHGLRDDPPEEHAQRLFAPLRLRQRVAEAGPASSIFSSSSAAAPLPAHLFKQIQERIKAATGEQLSEILFKRKGWLHIATSRDHEPTQTFSQMMALHPRRPKYCVLKGTNLFIYTSQAAYRANDFESSIELVPSTTASTEHVQVSFVPAELDEDHRWSKKYPIRLQLASNNSPAHVKLAAIANAQGGAAGSLPSSGTASPRKGAAAAAAAAAATSSSFKTHSTEGGLIPASASSGSLTGANSSSSNNSSSNGPSATTVSTAGVYSRSLFAGENTVYLFADSWKEKESWFYALYRASRFEDKEFVNRENLQIGDYANYMHNLQTLVDLPQHTVQASSTATIPAPSTAAQSTAAPRMHARKSSDSTSAAVAAALSHPVASSPIKSTYSSFVQPPSSSGDLGASSAAGSAAAASSSSSSSAAAAASGTAAPASIPPQLAGAGDASAIWFNALWGRLYWDMKCSDHVNGLFRKLIQKKLDKLVTPSFMGPIRIASIDLGDAPPLISSITSCSISQESGVAIFMDVAYRGDFTATLETNVKIDLETMGPFASSTAAANPAATASASASANADSNLAPATAGKPKEDTSMRARVKAKLVEWAGNVSSTPLTLTLNITSGKGKMVVHLGPPPTDRLWWGFEAMPVLEMTATPKIGSRAINLPAVTEWIADKLKEEIRDAMVLPELIDSHIPIMHEIWDSTWRVPGHNHHHHHSNNNSSSSSTSNSINSSRPPKHANVARNASADAAGTTTLPPVVISSSANSGGSLSSNGAAQPDAHATSNLAASIAAATSMTTTAKKPGKVTPFIAPNVAQLLGVTTPAASGMSGAAPVPAYSSSSSAAVHSTPAQPASLPSGPSHSTTPASTIPAASASQAPNFNDPEVTLLAHHPPPRPAPPAPSARYDPTHHSSTPPSTQSRREELGDKFKKKFSSELRVLSAFKDRVGDGIGEILHKK